QYRSSIPTRRSSDLYRDGKTARVLLSRYIGTGKLREFCFPAISGRENCASFAFPLYERASREISSNLNKIDFVNSTRSLPRPSLDRKSTRLNSSHQI